MAGKVNVPITVGIQGLTKSIAQLNTLGKGIGTVAKTAGLAAVGFAAFTAAAKFGDFTVDAVAGARDLERNLAGLDTVFENLAPRMESFAKSSANIGLSMNEASKSAVFIGSVLKQSGFTINETADLTERLVKLATDLSITYGYDVQEALLGMTALFRGEYDPIEKFGVAMKQSEVNAELAAQKLSHLEGAERRLAEQQIRVNFLFERSADAQGAMERQSGTLAAEQLKLAATFENVKNTVAASLLPVIADLTMELQGVMQSVGPELKQTFDDMAPVLEKAADVLLPAMVDGLMLTLDIFQEIINLLGEIFNPLTDIGESFTALGIQIESLFETLTGHQLTTENVFNGISFVIQIVVDLIHDLLYIIERTVIGFQVMGEMAAAFFTGDWDKLVNTDWKGQIEQQIALKDAIKGSKLEMAGLYAAAKASIDALGDQTEIWDLPKKVKVIPKITANKTPGTGSSKAIKDYVGDLTAKIKDEVLKQRARLQLETMTGSQGLIDMILGSEGWMTIWTKIKSGTLSLETLEKQFYNTAAGAKELADAVAEAEAEWTKYDEAIDQIQENLDKELASIAEHFDDVRLSFSDLMAEFSVLKTVERQLGEFEQSAVSMLASIEDSLKSAFRNKDLLESNYNDLRAYAQREIALLTGVERKRDELASRYNLAEGLINEYRTALTASLSLTNLLDKLSNDVQTRTVTETSQGVIQLGNDLRSFNVTVIRSYEETLGSVADKSVALLDGFRTMAEKARVFADNLRKLKALGLDPMLFDQLVQAGVEAGGETAQALVDGGAETVSEISSIFREIDELGGELGFEVSQTYYDAGQSLIDQLLAGMRAEQQALEDQAVSMAKSFSEAFSANLNLAIGAAQSAAESVAKADAQAEIAKVPVPEVPRPETMVDTAALKQLDALIAKAGSYADNINDATKAAGALVKQDIYGQLRDVVASGGKVDLSGIESGLSSAELAQRAANATTNNITINVQTDATQSTAMVGKQIGSIVTSYVQSGGQVLTS